MGFFDFLKSAGAEESGPKRELTPTFFKQNMSNLGFNEPGLNIHVMGDQVRLSGTVSSQTVKEKIVLAIGNTKGVARVEDTTTVEKKEPEAKFYTVKSGDTLSKISKEMYGDMNKYNKIFEANKPMLTDVNKIYPGQVLRIPTTV
jgi:nucleoid-associated protein YgaU